MGPIWGRQDPGGLMGPTWGPSGADRTQVGPMLAPWTLLSGRIYTGLSNNRTSNFPVTRAILGAGLWTGAVLGTKLLEIVHTYVFTFKCVFADIAISVQMAEGISLNTDLLKGASSEIPTMNNINKIMTKIMKISIWIPIDENHPSVESSVGGCWVFQYFF